MEHWRMLTEGDYSTKPAGSSGSKNEEKVDHEWEKYKREQKEKDERVSAPASLLTMIVMTDTGFNTSIDMCSFYQFRRKHSSRSNSVAKMRPGRKTNVDAKKT